MKEDQLNIDETSLSVDLIDATQAVKESRFEDALNLLTIYSELSKNNCKVIFNEPQFAITPGQSVVFYIDNKCMGGAIIDKRF